MPAYTYLSDSEGEAGRVCGDPEVNDLLATANKFDDRWRIRTHVWQPRKRWFRKRPPPRTEYTLYWYTGHGIEYQVINLHGGTVFNGSVDSKADVANFLMGYINGRQDAARLLQS